jgi:hypothetical protein
MFDYDKEAMFAEVAGVAAKGWKIVRLWGVRDNYTCTCGRLECPTPGKHPHGGAGWGDRATDDEDTIWSWFENVEEHTRCNVGVRLGPVSGIIDVEFDSPEAEAVLKRFGLHEIDTPTYKAGRGLHRIFQHDSGLPDAGVVKVEGLEVRLGGGEASSQSVIPPSWHKSGVQYQWLPGKSPSDVNPAPLPPDFKSAILDCSRKRGSGVIAQAMGDFRDGKKVAEGGRHAHLVGIASKWASRITKEDITDAGLSELIQMMIRVNAVDCVPPKSADEVIKISKDQFNYYRQKKLERLSSRPLERFGLSWNFEERRWDPGDWKLTIVESEPPEYKLRVPKPGTERRQYTTVHLDAGQWMSGTDVAKAILEATTDMDVFDPNKDRWCKTWMGESIKEEGGGWRSVRGLKSILMEEADREIPPPESNVSVLNAGIMYQYLRFTFSKVEPTGDPSDKLPNSSGLPKWIFNDSTGEWEMWLIWTNTCTAAWKKAGYQAPSRNVCVRLKAQILEHCGEENWKRKKRAGEHCWYILKDRHIDALAEMSHSA